MAFESQAASERQELIDLAHEALDQYEAMESDLAALVSDLDDILGQLRPLFGSVSGAEMRDAWRQLAVVYEESSSYGRSELGTATVAAAVHEVRALLDR